MFWMWILIIIAAIIIVTSIFMAPDNNSFSGALVGSSDLDLFKVTKERGSKKFLKFFMWCLGVSLLVISIIIRATL